MIRKDQFEITHLPEVKTSKFWISCGEFSLALEIDYIGITKLRLLYDIFCQTSYENKYLNFGIDNNKFYVNLPLDIYNISSRMPLPKGNSQYWFSTGGEAISFSGRYLSSHKIQRLFLVIKETMEETGIVRFGVDEVEFSKVPEFWYQPRRLSLEAQYDMNVSLQIGDNEDLEERKKYAWPAMTSDLHLTDYETEDYENMYRNMLSLSRFGNDLLDEKELSMPRNSLEMMDLERYCDEYENVPLDQLFDNRFGQQRQQQWQKRETKSNAETMNTVENEKQRLTAEQEQLSNYAKPSRTVSGSLDITEGISEYEEKLKNMLLL